MSGRTLSGACHSTATPVTNMANVASMNGAPRMAPTLTAARCLATRRRRWQSIGIMVSGRAVPTAARTDPTAPSASSSLRPNHSIPFVNSSAPSRITTKEIANDESGPPSVTAAGTSRARLPIGPSASVPHGITADQGRRCSGEYGSRGDDPRLRLSAADSLTLVTGTGPGLAPGLDLGPLRQVAPEPVHFLVVDLGGLGSMQ